MAKQFKVDIDLNGNLITDVQDPVSPQDAATKAYVDANIGGGSAGLSLPPVEKTTNFTATLDDKHYLNVRTSDGSTVVATLPTVTSGDIGKVLVFSNISNAGSPLYIQDYEDGTMSSANGWGVNVNETLMLVVHKTDFPSRWLPIYIRDYTDEIQAVQDSVANFIPYTGANTLIDLGGVGIDNPGVIQQIDANLNIQTVNPMSTLGTGGTEIGFSASPAYGDGDGGRITIIAGSADYTTVDSVGNGGIIYMQVGAPGEAGGERGHVRIDSPGWGAAQIYIDDLTTDRTYQMPDNDGTFVTFNSSDMINNVDAVVSSNGWGIFSGGDGTGRIKASTLTASRDYQLPDAAGTIALESYVDDAVAAIPDASNKVTRVIHGSTAGTARPSGVLYVEWVGSVAPTNATADDTWVDTN